MKYTSGFIKKKASIITIVASSFLSGCATLSALTLQEVRGQENYTLTLDYVECTTLQNDLEALSPILLGQIYDSGLKAFKSYIQKKASRFTKKYAVSATFDDFSPGKCLRIRRVDEYSRETHLDLVLEINGRGDNSAEIIPTYLLINKFAASSAPQEKNLKARITVSLGISFVNENTRFGTDAVTSLNIPIASTVYTLGEDATDPNIAFNGQTSKLFPALYSQPVNVVVSISEVGNGSDIFDDSLSSFDINAEYLKSLIGGELQ